MEDGQVIYSSSKRNRSESGLLDPVEMGTVVTNLVLHSHLTKSKQMQRKSRYVKPYFIPLLKGKDFINTSTKDSLFSWFNCEESGTGEIS